MYLRELSFFTGRGVASICGRDQNFLGWSKGGGPVFLSCKEREGGGQEVLRCYLIKEKVWMAPYLYIILSMGFQV